MLTLGITGGIGSGKSTAARFFADRGARLFDADVEAKQILMTDRDVSRAVQAAFGEAVLNDMGAIDVHRLAAASFATPEAQQRLNAIIHPQVIAASDRGMATARKQGVALYVLDVPLLFEAHMERGLDLTLVVVADEARRFQRALARGNLTENDLRRRATLQLTDEERRAQADHIIDNNGTLDDLHRHLQRLFDTLMTEPES